MFQSFPKKCLTENLKKVIFEFSQLLRLRTLLLTKRALLLGFLGVPFYTELGFI